MQKNRLLLALILISSPLTAYADWGAPTAPANVPIDLDTAIMKLTNWLLGIIGLIAVLVIIYGGVLYLTSAGNDDQSRSAKETIKTGVMGLLIAGIAYAAVTVIVGTVLHV